MHFEPNLIYHVYNRGNNRELVFFREENYHFFLDKLTKHILPFADILCYCLMPNHYHIQLVPNEKGCLPNKAGQQKITTAFRVMMSSYTQAINRQENRTGSLFQQKLQAKLGWGAGPEEERIYRLDLPFTKMVPYIIICFRYIHRNPVKAGLVSRVYDWEFSSAADYVGIRDNKICNYKLAEKLLGIKRMNGIEDYENRLK